MGEFVNKQECDVLLKLYQNSYSNQRELAEISGHSLGIVNRSIKNLTADGYLDGNMCVTQKSREVIESNSPKSAVILAAGFGMRMVPINTEMPKGLLTVRGEVLIERMIRQLYEAQVKKIYVIVGFMKEQYEYLIDKYGVELIVNDDYATKNNLHSLKLTSKYISNTYIVPCDIWCKENPFNKNELYSWYMVSDSTDSDSSVKVNRKGELVCVSADTQGNTMVGISYICDKQSGAVCKKIDSLCADSRYDGAFWEEALYDGNKMTAYARVTAQNDYAEINTFEQLREFDSNSHSLKSDAIATICQALQVYDDEITDITVLKKGMTNRSFLFSCRGKKYIMRIPGEGTDNLINREQEAAVYRTIQSKSICDDVVYINSDNGYKITAFLENARVCDPSDVGDIRLCMAKLRDFHNQKLKVGHTFDIFGQIEFYESLWGGIPSAYKDYREVKEKVLSLKTYIDTHAEPYVLTHIDAVPDNFLFYKNGQGNQEIRLIDWEYAGMQDPHVDIAMFCIYAMYSREEVERLIDVYFEGNCPSGTRLKIYCYIAACGLLWSNWCEYKRIFGIEFGEYSLRQYRFAKDYYRIALQEFEKGGGFLCTE